MSMTPTTRTQLEMTFTRDSKVMSKLFGQGILEVMCINQQDLDGGIEPSTSITITEALGRIASVGDTDLTKYRALVRFLPAPLVLALKGSYA